MRLQRMLALALLVSAPAPAAAQSAAAPPAPVLPAAEGGTVGYYRSPTLCGGTIVFAAEGDLWSVGTEGGTARRLTTHPGEESSPALSPDGSLLAFNAAYEGPSEVYLMPATGGLPQRLTWNGGGDRVVGWTPDGRILVSTRRYSTLPSTQLETLNPATGKRTLFPLAQAADGTIDPSSGTLFFTRLAKQSSNTRRYHGGTAENLWSYQLSASTARAVHEATPLTGDYAGTSKNPMLYGGRIYFASDRDGVMNVWSMNPDGSDVRQHTHHRDFDVQAPAMDGGRVIYQDGPDLWLLDVRSGQDRRIPIRLASDFDQLRTRWVTKPMEWVTAAHLSPDGDRVVLTARGQLFVAPAGDGRLVRATRNDSVRYRSGRFLPDGKRLVALSDRSDEVELWTVPANGVGAEEQLTRDGEILRWDEIPSPDGKQIAHTDKNQRLWVYDVAQHRSVQVAKSPYGDVRDPVWSPDSRWLAYVETAPNLFSRLWVYDTQSGKSTAVTTDRYDSYSPAWSPDGKWLWFLSDRHFDSSVGSPWGSRQPEPFFDEQTKVYALALQPDARFPFRPEDELAKEPAAKDSSDSHGSKGAASPEPVRIALGGIEGRLYEVPVPAGNYRDLATDGKRLYWLSSERGERGAALQALEVANDDPKPQSVVDGVRSYELSLNGKKLMVRKGDDLYVFDAGTKAPGKLADAKVDLSGWRFAVDPRAELRQMYTEAWRLERDYYWDPGMRGLDWNAIRAKYQPLADRVTSREELSDVLAQMIAELETLHEFVYGGDMRKGDDQVLPASLGAVLTRDEAASGWRVEHIYRADPDEPQSLSPLARPGVGVKEGEVITAVNGVPALSVPDVGALMQGQAGKQVLLAVRGADGAERRVVVEPIPPREAADLRYDEWEYTRRLAVDSLSGGRIGYVHLRAMGSDDIAQWERDFYPMFNRDALIIDMRANRGGNIDSWVLEKLMRRPWMYFKDRVGKPTWNMQYAVRGPMVVLVDQNTASDGEAFSEGFRRLGLGKVIGTRTWGGEVWLSSSNVLVDRGIATAAEMGVYGPEGRWLIEGHGVDPDIIVDNLPAATFAGDDAQLEAAVKYLTAQMAAHPSPVPAPPSYPPIPKQ